MKRLTTLIVLLFIALGATAQLEVVPGSFKEVEGFVNINPDIQFDDNNKPYAVLKIKTENINDKQRHDLFFEGNAATFFEVEYKIGEVWVYLSYYATFIKISHPDFGTTEFWFPFDMQGKKGYELTLVNKSKAYDEEMEERMRRIEEALQNQQTQQQMQEKPEPQIIYVEKPVAQEEKETVPAKPQTPTYSFIMANAAMNSYSQLSYGFTIGSMKKVGCFFSMMSNFHLDGFEFEDDPQCTSEEFDNLYGSDYSGNYSYTSFSAMFGFIFKIYRPINFKIGVGYGNNSMLCKLNSGKQVWISDVSSYGISGMAGLQFHFGRFVLSLDGVTTNFKIYEGRLGIGIGIK